MNFQSWQRRHELKIMIWLGLGFLLLLLGGRTLSGVEVLRAELDARKDRIFAEIDALAPGKMSAVPPDLPGLLLFLENELSATAQALRQTTGNIQSAGAVTTTFTAADALLRAGTILLTTGPELLELQTYLQNELPLLLHENADLKAAFELTEAKVLRLATAFAESRELLETALRAPLPGQIRDQIQELQRLLTPVAATVEKIKTYLPAVATLLGLKHRHTTVIFLQNRNEIRPTGGFPGSLLFLEMDQGKIVQWEFTDIFHFSGQFALDLPVPPEFAHLTGVWTPHDCNTAPDFRISGARCISFLEYGKAATPDTVVAIHQGLLEDILRLTGPIPLPENEAIQLDAANVSFVLSYLIEGKIFGQGGPDSPKNILAPLLPEMLARLQQLPPTELFRLAAGWVRQKDIQVFSRDGQLQSIWEELDLAGAYLPGSETRDFLGVVNTNVSGNKSDAFIAQEITAETLVNLSGEMFHTVKIAREHGWSSAQDAAFDELFASFGSPYQDKEELKGILGAAPNIVFTRVYVPKGSRLLFAAEKNTQGLENEILPLEVEKEEGADFTLFTFFFPRLAQGESRQVELFLQSPQQLDLESGALVKFTALKQAGTQNTTFSKKFLHESGITVERAQDLESAELAENLENVYLIREE